MDGIMQMLEDLEEIIDQGRSLPFSNKVSLDKDELFNQIQEIRLNVPKEIEQSNWVIEERNRILIDAQREADEIISNAKEQFKLLIDENEITKQATTQAEAILEQSKLEAKEMRLGTYEYADHILLQLEDRIKDLLALFQKETHLTEKFFNETIAEIYKNRLELRGGAKK